MKKSLIFMLVFAVLFVSVGVVILNKLSENPYADIDKTMWSYKSITNLYRKNILIPESENFQPAEYETRANIMNYLYRYAKSIGENVSLPSECVFEDVSAEDTFYDAVCWAYGNEIASGNKKNIFGPFENCSRQDVCTFMMRFADKYELKLKKDGDETQFKDSLEIEPYARSYVAACKLAGIVKGDEKGYFNPYDEITREEAVVMIDKFIQSVSKKTKNPVYAQKGKYDYLYEGYVSAPFISKVGESRAVADSWFDDAVFIGDSISVRLQLYSAAKGLLGKATFLCATSLSPENVLSPVTEDSIHPSVGGQKVSVPDGLKMSKAKKIYIMLGINSLRGGVDVTVHQLKNFITYSKKVLPQAKIFVQSVTPMTKDSDIYADNLNNDIINEYNRKVNKMCDENGWYYINIAKAVSDENGYLKDEYCSDNPNMGIHFNSKAAQVWVDYLKTHVPKKLKG